MGSMAMLAVTVGCGFFCVITGVESIGEVNQELNVPTDNETTDVIHSKRSIFHGNEGRCDVLFGQKCFSLIMSRASMTLGEAETVCKEAKGKLANVYSEEHFNMLRALIRSRAEMGKEGNSAWLGMKVDKSTKRVKLSTGESAPYTVWMKNHPHAPPAPYVGFYVVIDNLNRNHQGYVNMWSSGTLHGTICESNVSCRN